MSPIPTAYREVIDPLIDVARRIVEEGESLAPVAFAGNLTERRLQQVMMRASSEQAKDESADLVRRLAAEIGADFVFLIMGAWGLRPDKIERYEEILEEYGSIGASPYRIDIVAFTLETRHGTWVAQCEVTDGPDAGSEHSFADPEFMMVPGAEGRFTDLLPPTDDDGAPPRVLH